MKSLIVSIALIALVAFAAPLAVAEVTSGTTVVSTSVNGPVTLVTWDWASDSAGRVVKSSPGIVGTVDQIQVSSISGTTAPTNAFDITLLDTDGHDVAQGLLGNLSTASVLRFHPYMKGSMTDQITTTALPVKIPVTGALQLRVLNAGDAKEGKVRVWLKE